MITKKTVAVQRANSCSICRRRSAVFDESATETHRPGRVREVFVRYGTQVIPFVTAGFPSLRETTDVVRTLVDEGVRLLEIGIPFSDPVADGPTLQHTSYEALRRGTTPGRVLELAGSLRDTGVTTVIMTYLNPIVARGTERFLREAAEAGVGGLIVSDLIPEESGALRALTSRYGIDTIFLVSPVTERHRRTAVYRASTGFVYLVTVTGTTGARTELPPEFVRFARTVRRETQQPLCAGFGISKPSHIRRARRYLDGFIIGSALADIVRTETGTRRLRRIRSFIRPFIRLCTDGASDNEHHVRE